METNTPEPARGQRIGAEWARSLTRSVNEHARLLAAHADPVAQNRRAGRSRHPFEVAGTSVDGKAAFTICLPGGCLAVGESALSPDGVSPVPGEPSLYYVGDDALGELPEERSAAKDLRLVISRDSEGVVTARIDAREASGGDQNGAELILAATIARIFKVTVAKAEGTTPAKTAGCVAEQLVRSSVAIGRQVGEGSGSYPSDVRQVDVVVGATYDTYTHEFRLVRKRVTVLAEEDVPTSGSDLVFTATSHEAEHVAT